MTIFGVTWNYGSEGREFESLRARQENQSFRVLCRKLF